ncbi:hypothetical protein CDCA_CDCA20G4783 [Cyanidium caldarium]|uniref:BPL/LPL catalytic domain-containing protein n=1 Tax=Cyanidium caldarium TaxID=2771 RepID=A0AAV9J423_CYACA|nr:hypothetical protein CDCA_CDCA20G4783 [Cyanidium caldarium]
MQRPMTIYCDTLAWRQYLLSEYGRSLSQLRDAGYAVRLAPWEAPKAAVKESVAVAGATAGARRPVASGGGAVATDTAVAPLDAQRVLSELEALRQARPVELRRRFPWVSRSLLYAPVVSSTQDLIRSVPLPNGTVIVADEQTAGRGRGAASWTTPRGSLAFSMACQCMAAPARFSLQFVQYVAALSLLASMPDDTPDAQKAAAQQLRIKWPNDVLADGHKVAGVLCEAQCYEDRFTIYIGIGVNVLNEQPTVALRRLPYAASATREHLLARFLSDFETSFDVFVERGWEASGLRERYLQRWLHTDQAVTLADTGQHGRIVGLSDTGCLLVRVDEDGSRETVIELQPDVHSFDWVHSVVYTKRMNRR